MSDPEVDAALQRARGLAAANQDAAAKQAYLDILRVDPAHLAALREFAALASESGHRSAAITLYRQAVQHHPADAICRVQLARLLYDAGEPQAAKAEYRAAVAIDPDLAPAHLGLAKLLTDLGEPGAEPHWQRGFSGPAISTMRYRGGGTPLPLLLLVCARGGNIPTEPLRLDRHFAVTAIYADVYDAALPLPPHALVLNAIADADCCAAALAGAEAVLLGSQAPVINPPARVRATGRAESARRLADIPGLTTPRIRSISRARLANDPALSFPLLVRSPGFHTGQHFVFVPTAEALRDAIAGLPGDELLAIQYLDARGRDGLARKYRVMVVDGALYPVHLAISGGWKVHYYRTDMAVQPDHREEERRFLTDMPGILGAPAMHALAQIATRLGLDYAGMDFALGADGSVLLFEANAAMVVAMPDADPIWDYRRPALTAVLDAVTRMLLRRAGRQPLPAEPAADLGPGLPV